MPQHSFNHLLANFNAIPICRWCCSVAEFCIVAAGLVYRAMGFPPQFFTVLFAIPRVTGYLAHWRESLTDPDTRSSGPSRTTK